MQDACPPGQGSMAAIMGMSCAEVEAICFESSKHGVVTGANYNCPGQIVISGEKKAVEVACQKVGHRGGKAIPLPVSAPFHCSLMEPAAFKLERDLKKLDIEAPRVPVYANVTGDRITKPKEIEQCLIRQVTQPILWQVDVESMIRDGASLFIEVGPGKILSGFGRRIDSRIDCIPFGGPRDLDVVLDFYKGASLK